MKAYHSAAVYLVVLTLAIAWLPPCFATESEASIAINEAELDMNLTFATVAAAEDAGADIEVLIGRLTSAGDSLSEAHTAFRAGNYEAASSHAVECSNVLEGLDLEADRLIEKAEREKSDNLILTLAGSGIGVIILLVLAIMGWSVLRERYYSQVPNMKPEVEVSP